METMTETEALDRFNAWYNDCLENGISPEDIVESVGEMKLLVTQEQIDSFENRSA